MSFAGPSAKCKGRGPCPKARAKAFLLFIMVSLSTCDGVAFCLLFDVGFPEAWDTHLVSTDPPRHKMPHCDSGMLGTHPILAFPALMPRPPPGWKVAKVMMGQGVGGIHSHQGAGEQAKNLSWGGKEAGPHTNQGSKSPEHASSSHQTAFTKQKFKVKIIKNFWLANTEQ